MYTAKRGYRPGDEPVAGYHLTKFLGKGQFGEVWQAKAPGGMQVALKLIDLGEREGLKEFSGLLQVKDIRHANLVEFVACWVKTESGQVLDELPTDPVAALSPRDSSIEIGGTMLFDASGAAPTRPVELIVAMSLGSKTLYRRLQEVNPGKEQKDWVGMPEDELLDYMEQAARGIDYLNQRGIIHGDIKPQNLLIVGDSVKVCDFGLARAVTNLRMTQSGMGTVAYAAPELFEGKPHIQSDQYCLAVSFIELRTGSLPFEEPNPYKVIELHRNGRLDFQKLTRGERGVMRQATAIRPERRWSTCTEMVRRLREARHQEQQGGGGGWFSFLRSRPEVAATQQLPPPEESAVEEPAGAQPDAEVAAKKDSAHGETGKKDSGRKKSGPQSPAAARAIQTVRRRGDDTDAIAATVASENLSELPRRARPSALKRVAKACVGLAVVGALAFGGYKFSVSEAGKRALATAVGWFKSSEEPAPLPPPVDEKPTRETVKKKFFTHLAAGGFGEAADAVSKAKESLTAADHEKLCAEIRSEWGDPSLNPVLQQLRADAIRPVEAAHLFETAEATSGFNKLVEGVPESLWLSVRERWLITFEAIMAGGSLEKAAEECSSVPPKLLPQTQKDRLRVRILDQWLKRFDDLMGKRDLRGAMAELEGSAAKAILDPTELGKKRTLVCLAWNQQFQEMLASKEPGAFAKAMDELKQARGVFVPEDEYSKRLAGLQESWSRDFDASVAKDDWEAADRWLSGVPTGLFSPSELDAKRESIREQRRKTWIAKFDGAVQKGDWEAAELLASHVPASLFTPQELKAKLAVIADRRRKTWSAAFEALVAEAKWSAAKEKLDHPPAGLFEQPDLDKMLAQLHAAWDTAMEAPVGKNDWLAAKKLLDDIPPAFFSPTELEKRVAKVQTAWNRVFDDHVAKGEWPAAEEMMASVPAGLILPSEIDQKRAVVRTQRQQKWDAGFNGSVEKGEWDAAKTALDTAPMGLFTEQELQTRQGRLETAWSEQFKGLLKKKEWDPAQKSLDYALAKLFPGSPGIEKLGEEIQKGRHMEEMDALDKSISELRDAGRFTEAKQRLDEAVAQKMVSAEKAGAWEKDLRGQWFAWIRGNWDKSDQADMFKGQVAGFLKASPEAADADEVKLLRARLLVRLGQQTKSEKDLKDAEDDLRALDKMGRLPANQAYLLDVLQVITKLKPREKLAERTGKAAAPWDLTPWESQELARIPLPPPPPPPSMPGSDQLAAIRKALGSARELLPLVEKRFPAAKPDGWDVTDPSDVKLVTRQVPAGLAKLAAAPAYPEQPKDLGRAAAWLQAARGKFPGYAETSVALQAVLGRRIALRVFEPQGPSQDDWSLVSQWEELDKEQSEEPAGAADELLVKGWRVECMLALGKEAASVRDHLVTIRAELLKAQPAYGHYLWCRALRAAPDPAWSEIVRELTDLAPALEGQDAILKAQGRAGAVVGLIVEAAQKRREQARPWNRLDQVPFNPFADPAEAEEYAVLLKAARKFPGAGENPELKASLALAACHEAKPESALAWSLARGLLPLRDAGMQPDLLPLLYAGVSGFWQQPGLAKLPADDPQWAAAIRATTQLLREFSKDEAGKISRKQKAAALYKAVLQPVIEDPELQAVASKPGAGELVSELSGAAAKFLDNQKDVEWPFPKSAGSVYHVIESQATRAMDLDPKGKEDPARLVDYHVLRGSARAYKSDFNSAEVLADADAALKFQPKLHAALGVRAYALFMRAQEQSKRDQILKDLADAIVSGEAAMTNCPKGHKQFPGYMLNLANAHLWLGNFETDQKAKQQHFDLARTLAGDAAKLEHDYGDEARFLLGNIYEDLASQVGENPKANYLEAKKRFSQVLERNPLSAQAFCSLARCHYKALVQSRLGPQDFGFRDRDSFLRKCRDDLEKAIGFAVKDSDRIEALRYLGDIYAEQDDWGKADESLTKARDQAKRLGASSRAAYVYAWAMLPITHADRLLSSRTRKYDDPEIVQLLKTAEERADVLKGESAGQFVIPTKQVARIKGLSFGLKKEYDRAVQAYDAGLPRDLKQADASDVGLLLGRAACHLALCKFDENGKLDPATLKHAKAVLPDAKRALEVAMATSERASAQFYSAEAHLRMLLGGEDQIGHVNEFVKCIREAVRLTPQGTSAVAYRLYGGRLVTSMASLLAGANRDAADAILKEARGWLEEALDLEPDASKKKEISQILEVIDAKLSAPPAPVE